MWEKDVVADGLKEEWAGGLSRGGFLLPFMCRRLKPLSVHDFKTPVKFWTIAEEKVFEYIFNIKACYNDQVLEKGTIWP